MTSAVRTAVAAAILAAAVPAHAEGPEAVGLPRDFRSWTHVRSMVVTDADEGMYGFHNVYANAAALRVLRSGKVPVVYPDGATFVVSIFEPRTEKGAVVAGAKQRDVVQVKDSRAKATGGWRFASFDANGKPIRIDPGTCAGCHAGADSTDRVFTRYTP